MPRPRSKTPPKPAPKRRRKLRIGRLIAFLTLLIFIFGAGIIAPIVRHLQDQETHLAAARRLLQLEAPTAADLGVARRELAALGDGGWLNRVRTERLNARLARAELRLDGQLPPVNRIRRYNPGDDRRVNGDVWATMDEAAKRACLARFMARSLTENGLDPMRFDAQIRAECARALPGVDAAYAAGGRERSPGAVATDVLDAMDRRRGGG